MMPKLFSYDEVAKHNDDDSCWVILYGNVYDVTNFLPNHPGGSKIVLSLAGQDATEEYDPVHPQGTLESHLPPEAKLGKIDQSTVPVKNRPSNVPSPSTGPAPLDTLLNLADIEDEATKRISHKAWAYYYSAADDLISKRLNNAIYQSILLRPRIFVDCVECSTETSILGYKTSTPIFVSPAAMARMAHPDGESGIARACAKFGAVQMISQNASMTPEQIVQDAQPGQTFGWQLYVQQDRKKSENMLARIEKLKDKVKFIVLTLDAPVPGKREHDERAKNVASNLPVPSATRKEEGGSKRGGIGAQLFMGTAADLTWKTTLPWLAQHSSLPIVLKGVQTHEDAYLASLHAPQIHGIILSNHGGRAADTAPPSIHTLLEIRKFCPEVFNRLDVFVDGGIRRGTDVVKALCLGAKAVGIGRPALFGLGAGGQAGVERVFEILQDEIATTMRLLGVANVYQLGLQHVNARVVEQQIYNGPDRLERPPRLWALSKL